MKKILSAIVVLVIVVIIAFAIVPNFKLFAKDKAEQTNVKIGEEVSLEHLKNEVLNDISNRENEIKKAYIEVGQLKSHINRYKIELTEKEDELAKVKLVLERGRNSLANANGGMVTIGTNDYTSETVTKSLGLKIAHARTLQVTIEDTKTQLALLEDGYKTNIAAIKEAKSGLENARAELQNNVALLASREELQKVRDLISGFDAGANLYNSNISAAQKELNRRMDKVEAEVEYQKFDSGMSGDEVDWSGEVASVDILSEIDSFLGESNVIVDTLSEVDADLLSDEF